MIAAFVCFYFKHQQQQKLSNSTVHLQPHLNIHRNSQTNSDVTQRQTQNEVTEHEGSMNREN
jgi:hypothetical protein